MPMKSGRPNGAPTNTGITLIALIITIIILLILAGVAIHFTLGENGILRNAETAGKKYSEASVKETIQNILADMQMEEIKNGRKLDLEKLAQNLASKDNNITITEYEEGAKELKGTYTINGQEYEFTINNKFEVEVKESTDEKIVKIEEIIWENGKPKVTLTSSQEGTIEYKDENGEWKPYNEEVNVKEGDTLTVRVKTSSGTTKEETIVIKDKTAPTEFTIEIANEFIKAKAVTVNLKTTPVDNETGLKDYTYIAEGNGSKKEIANVTSTSYKITELEPETSYTVYVLAYDNAGNYRKSNVVTITTPVYIPPTISTPTEGDNTIREGNQLPFIWAQLSEISGIISNNSNITNDTNEFSLNYDGTDYTIGVGDWTTVKVTEEDEEGNRNERELRVQIIGFNHDILAGQVVNDDETINEEYLDLTNSNQIKEEVYDNLRKAGISFEFIDCVENINVYMDYYGNNRFVWSENPVRTTTLIEILDKISIKDYIKTVTKISGVAKNSTNVTYLNSRISVLSCAEIWGTSSVGTSHTSGYSKSMEGEQYKYYKNISPEASQKNSYLVNPLNGTVLKNSLFLRSVDATFKCTCILRDSGSSSYVSPSTSQTCELRPIFSI